MGPTRSEPKSPLKAGSTTSHYAFWGTQSRNTSAEKLREHLRRLLNTPDDELRIVQPAWFYDGERVGTNLGREAARTGAYEAKRQKSVSVNTRCSL